MKLEEIDTPTYNIDDFNNEQLLIIKNFAASLVDKNTIDDILWDVARNVISKLGFIDCVIYLVDEKNKSLVQKAAYGPKSPKPLSIKAPLVLSINQGIVGSVARKGESEIINDTSIDPRYVVDDQKRLSEISVPIKLRHGRILGVIDSEHTEKNFFTQNHLHLLETISAIVASKIMLIRAHEAVKAQANELQIINAQYKRNAFIVSHDIKSPLANIQGLIDIYFMNKESGDEDRNDQVIELIQKSVKKLNNKVDDLNKLIESKSEPSKNTQDLDFHEMLKSVKLGIILEIRKNGVEIIEDFSKVPKIRYPKSYLESILLNLLTNAIKYRDKNKKPKIIIKTRKVRNYILLSVQDNGLGIDLKKHGNMMFQLFQRFHEDVEDGKGLGLNIVKSQVESLGGKIEVESTVGKGTTFNLYLNILDEDPS